MSMPKKTKNTPAVRQPKANLAVVDEKALITDLRGLIHAARQRIAVVAKVGMGSTRDNRREDFPRIDGQIGIGSLGLFS